MLADRPRGVRSSFCSQLLVFPDGVTMQVSRQTVTSQYRQVGENDYRAVGTGHLPFTEIESEDVVEVASVYVRVPTGQVAKACAAATAVAELVWPELPDV